MENVFVFEQELDKEFICDEYINFINKSNMYRTDIDTSLLLIEKKYIIYPFISGSIKNLGYFYVKGNIEKNGVINGEFQLVDGDFIIKELEKEKFILSESRLDEFDLYNSNKMSEAFNAFLKGFKERIIDGVCQRHNIRLTIKENKLDVDVIKDFDELKRDYYLEGIYVVSYIYKKKKYTSIYSPLQKRFYSFDSIKNEKFIEYLKYYKKPIVSIPKDYLDIYYEKSFKVYLDVLNELNYITKEDLFHKSKENIKYKKNIKYYEYLNKLIFYFKRSKYLSLYECNDKCLRSKIFYYYFTVDHNLESGNALGSLIKLGIIRDNYIKMLEKSCKLGNLQSKKTLYEYYSKPQYYNETLMKRYI